MTVITNSNITRLIHALQLHFSEKGTFHPVDTTAMNTTIQAVIQTAISMDNSNEARVNRVLTGHSELEQPVEELITLARPLANTDGNIYDALLYLDGKLIS
jgi:hypothetical protein